MASTSPLSPRRASSMAFQLYYDFLQPDKTARHTFTDKATELTHINEQLHHLNRHITNLLELRSALLYRSNQLTSPTYIVPHEVLLYIFNQANEMEWCPPNGRKSIIPPQKAMVLSAVSRQWRHVALGTSELWQKVECRGPHKTYRDSSLLIQHCASYASSLEISLLEQGYELDSADETFDTTTTVLSSSDVTGKLKALDLQRIPSPQWIRLLPSFPRLESLSIFGGNHPSVDLSSLPLSRVYLIQTTFDSLILPPSVLVLHLEDYSLYHSVNLLRNCPRLIEFCSKTYIFSRVPMPPILSNPLALNSLKKLVWSPAQWLMEAASATGLNIPLIENLELGGSEDLRPAPLALLCHQISASLESLTLRYFFANDNWSIVDLRHLFTFPIPTLRKLSLTDWSHCSILDAICALTPDEGEDGYTDRCLPKLEYLSISSEGEIFGREFDFDSRVLNLVKLRRIGENSPFHLDFSFSDDVADYDAQAAWQPELLHELKEFVANRPVKVTIKGGEAELDRLPTRF